MANQQPAYTSADLLYTRCEPSRSDVRRAAGAERLREKARGFLPKQDEPYTLRVNIENLRVLTKTSYLYKIASVQAQADITMVIETLQALESGTSPQIGAMAGSSFMGEVLASLDWLVDFQASNGKVYGKEAMKQIGAAMEQRVATNAEITMDDIKVFTKFKWLLDHELATKSEAWSRTVVERHFSSANVIVAKGKGKGK